MSQSKVSNTNFITTGNHMRGVGNKLTFGLTLTMHTTFPL